ncbi:dTMP kinase [Lentilactobacillus curieae]|uniref:Thymidylate kinase n=1 Tax=Lentilactobacillus curieae TaxID=1138822 RepID=A0A1S6QJN7_9LACO|nr:dTMP kinase [Lentilactobacillus curieae]AQW21815.1 dTMP kinase [Lentilactobacillus curieae]
MTGKFITFEGPDGAGKTTVMNNVVEKISSLLGDRLLVTREPGGNKISEQIRNVILDRKNTEMDARTEALLYSAARRQHLVETIIPALNAGKLVLCDRYVDSSVAYQGSGRQIGMDEVYQMNRFATEDLLPFKTIYFDIPVQVGLDRIAAHRSKDAVDRLDVEAVSFHERVHDGYLKVAKNNQERFVMIDATKPLSEVIESTISVIKTEAQEFFKE